MVQSTLDYYSLGSTNQRWLLARVVSEDPEQVAGDHP